MSALPPERAPTFEGHVPVADGGRAHVRRYGSVGPDLLLVHGGPDWDHAYLLPYVLPLADDLQLTLFDLRGCGRSSRFDDPEAYTPDAVVRDVFALLNELHLARPAILGVSFGGRIALRVAAMHPHRVGALVLASSTAYADGQKELEAWPEYRARRRDAAPTTEQLDQLEATADATRRLAVQGLPLDAYPPNAAREVRRAVDRVRFSGEWTRAWQGGVLARVTHPDYARVLAEHGTPLLIVHGDKDMRFPVSAARRLHDAVPGSELVVLRRVGHMAHIEASGAWCHAVRTFILRTCSPSGA